MDPLTHIVIGRALVAAARDERRNRTIGAAAILGALSPDADSAIAFAGWDRYVRAHQFGTHSLAGAIAMAAVTAIVVERSATFATSRRPGGERGSEASPARFTTLVGAATAGALSHIALDLVSGARLAIAWPLFERRVSLPLVAMADPWLVAICLTWLLMLWPLGIVLQRASRALVSVAVIFLCVKATLLGLALRRSDISSPASSAVEARWGSLTDWFVFERGSDGLRVSSISSRGGRSNVVMAEPLEPDSRYVRASRALDDVRNFLAVHEFAFPDETHGPDGRVSVMWSDLRYCWPAAYSDHPHGSARCGVGVGGVFDESGRAVTQEVRIGAIVQRRPPA
jgi:membrane-bound metal-dependent hydrolase YbcI (DUF457 family)